MELSRQIQQGLDEFPFTVAANLCDDFETYLNLLHQWNQTYNLTGIRDRERMVSHHLFDALSIVPLIRGEHIVDVGSGAGLPGIPLALYFPNKHFTLLDSNGKKIRFLTQAKIDLALDNVSVAQQRVEQFNGDFDQVVCRAFAPLDALAESCAHLLISNGTLLAMKGGDEEQLSADAPLEVVSRTQLQVPMVSEDRFVVTLAQRAT